MKQWTREDLVVGMFFDYGVSNRYRIEAINVNGVKLRRSDENIYITETFGKILGALNSTRDRNVKLFDHVIKPGHVQFPLVKSKKGLKVGQPVVIRNNGYTYTTHANSLNGLGLPNPSPSFRDGTECIIEHLTTHKIGAHVVIAVCRDIVTGEKCLIEEAGLRANIKNRKIQTDNISPRDMIKGQVYVFKDGRASRIFMFRDISNGLYRHSGALYLDNRATTKFIPSSSGAIIKNSSYYKPATREEESWLRECIKQGKYISKDLVDLADVHFPEDDGLIEGNEVIVSHVRKNTEGGFERERHGGYGTAKDGGRGLLLQLNEDYGLVELYDSGDVDGLNIIVTYKRSNLKPLASSGKQTNQLKQVSYGSSKERNTVKTKSIVSRVSRGQRPSGDTIRSRSRKSTVRCRLISYEASVIVS